jgi:hypothetical protein
LMSKQLRINVINLLGNRLGKVLRIAVERPRDSMHGRPSWRNAMM